MRLALTIAAAVAVAIGGLVIWAGSAEQPEAWNPPPPPARLAAHPGTFSIVANPQHANVDEPVRIAVRGAEPGEIVILRASTIDVTGERFTSWARFTSPATGDVDTETMKPLAGTYRSRDPSGLLWSMRAKDAHPYRFPMDQAELRFHVSAETVHGVAAIDIVRTNPAAHIAPKVVTQARFRADFWLPRSQRGQFPAVVRLHGSDGRFDPLQAALLVQNGFAVLDIYYGAPEIVAVPVERVLRGIDWLTRQSGIDGQRIGVVGASKGAELALLAATLDCRIRAVVAWAPSSVVFEGIAFTDLSPGSSWSWQGLPTPYAPFRLTPRVLLRHSIRLLFNREVSFLPIYEQALDGAPDDARIPVEQICASTLLLGGQDDRMWPAARMAMDLQSRLAAKERNHALVVYEQTGHRMKYALWPDLHTPSRVVGGGTPEQNHLAGRDAWHRIKTFLVQELSL